MQIGSLRQRVAPALNFHGHAVSFGQRHDLSQRCDAAADGGVHTYRTPAARTNGKADLLQIEPGVARCDDRHGGLLTERSIALDIRIDKRRLEPLKPEFT